MKRTWSWLLAGLAVACALGVRWWAAEPPPEAAAAVAPVASAPTPSTSAPTPDAAASTADARPPADRVRAAMSQDPVIEDRARQQQLAPEADARWQQAVDEGGYTANDLDVSIRELFRRVDLEPRYAAGGRIEGLVITGIAPDHPFAQLGFRAGDRIDRIQGIALRDPAEIPSLLARLGPNFELCVDRQGEALCGEVHLE